MAKRKNMEEDFQQSVDTRVSDALVDRLISSSTDLNLANSKENGLPRNLEEKPTITLNTRITKSLSDEIDDFIYMSKKNGNVETKQSLTIKALTKFLESKV